MSVRYVYQLIRVGTFDMGPGMDLVMGEGPQIDLRGLG